MAPTYKSEWQTYNIVSYPTNKIAYIPRVWVREYELLANITRGAQRSNNA
jgi:hypothetical protein